MFLRVILAAVAALYLAIATISSAHAGEVKITILKSRTVPIILPEGGTQGSDPCYFVRMQKSGRGGTQICDRHILTGTVGETSASVLSCRGVVDILMRNLRAKEGETFASLLANFNLDFNRSNQFDLDQKIEVLARQGVPQQCLFVISNEQSDHVKFVVVRTGPDDWILSDNVEPTEGSIVAWRDVLRQNAKAEYGTVSAHDGKFWAITSR